MLIIRIKDGQPFEHPILEENFRAAFPGIDLETLPSEFARFERVAAPEIGPYEVYQGVEYQLVDGVYKDVHVVTQLTDEEKTVKQNNVKLRWLEHGWPSWVFNEETCAFEPPIPKPEDNKRYRWDEATTSWIEVTLNV
jgi:hypothetical protein